MGEEGHHTVTVDCAVQHCIINCYIECSELHQLLNADGDWIGCVDARMLFPLKPIQIHPLCHAQDPKTIQCTQQCHRLTVILSFVKRWHCQIDAYALSAKNPFKFTPHVSPRIKNHPMHSCFVRSLWLCLWKPCFPSTSCEHWWCGFLLGFWFGFGFWFGWSHWRMFALSHSNPLMSRPAQPRIWEQSNLIGEQNLVNPISIARPTGLLAGIKM